MLTLEGFSNGIERIEGLLQIDEGENRRCRDQNICGRLRPW